MNVFPNIKNFVEPHVVLFDDLCCELLIDYFLDLDEKKDNEQGD
jgi:hypothetical protein